MSTRFEDAAQVFRRGGGILRMSEALRQGVNRRMLYAMRDEGVIEQLSRGLYRLAERNDLAAPDLVTVASRIPQGVICLISALAYHELTTQVPHAVDVAVVRGGERPRVSYPPINVYWFSGAAFTEGIETPQIDGVGVRIYCAEKSVADAFKYRNKIGTGVALEALRAWRQRRGSKVEVLLAYARVCRVERVIRPYLEAMT